MHPENNPVPVSVRQERHSGDRKQARSKGWGRCPERFTNAAAGPHLDTKNADERAVGTGRDVRVHAVVANRHLLVPS